MNDMNAEAIKHLCGANSLNQLKHAVIGFFVGVGLTLFCGFLYFEELKLQVVDDIQYERDYIINAYKPVLQLLTVEERVEWASNLHERERNVMCSYLSSICSETTED